MGMSEHSDMEVDMDAAETGTWRHLLSNDRVHKSNEGAGPLGKSPDFFPICDDLHRKESGSRYHCPVPESCREQGIAE